MEYFFYILLIIACLYGTRIVIRLKSKEIKDYSHLYQNKECKLHSWVHKEEFKIYQCSNCNFIAGTHLTTEDDYEN